jgi:hypothetical protein
MELPKNSQYPNPSTRLVSYLRALCEVTRFT